MSVRSCWIPLDHLRHQVVQLHLLLLLLLSPDVAAFRATADHRLQDTILGEGRTRILIKMCVSLYAT